jgi:small-conductance mechanosensitive channel
LVPHWDALVTSLLVISVALATGWFVGSLAVRAARRWAKHSGTIVDDALLQHLSRPLRWLFPVAALTLAFPLIRVHGALHDNLQHILVVSLTLLVGWVFFKSLRVVEQVAEQRYNVNVEDNLQARAMYTQLRGLRNIAGFVIAIVTFGFALLSFDGVRQVGAGLLASAGVAGVVIGFAAQRSIATILAGLQIAIAQPIRVDDVVIVEGEWGRIEEVTLTYVVVRIWDLRRLIVPITYFIEKPFQNWTRTSAEILGTVELHVDYGVDVDAMRAELKCILDASPHWDEKVWGLQVTGSSERSMLLRTLMSAKDASAAWELRCEVREKLIAFLKTHYPNALPRLRAELTSQVQLSNGSLGTQSATKPAGMDRTRGRST